MDLSLESAQNDQILNYIQKLEKRISQLEAHLNVNSEKPEEEIKREVEIPEIVSDSSETLEFKIGQNWLAKAGIIVLAIGIILTLIFPYSNFPSYLPSLIGFAFVAGILVLSHFFRKSFTLISRYLFGGGLLLLYFSNNIILIKVQ